MLLAFASPGVGVAMNSRVPGCVSVCVLLEVWNKVPGEFVGAREALCASGESAGVRLFARVRPDVTGLVLEAVEGLVAEWALVGTRKVLSWFFLLLWGVLQERSHEAHGSGSHVVCGSRALEKGE